MTYFREVKEVFFLLQTVQGTAALEFQWVFATKVVGVVLKFKFEPHWTECKPKSGFTKTLVRLV